MWLANGTSPRVVDNLQAPVTHLYAISSSVQDTAVQDPSSLSTTFDARLMVRNANEVTTHCQLTDYLTKGRLSTRSGRLPVEEK